MNKRVLIIDDDAELCEELGDIFQGEGFEFDIAHSGDAAQVFVDQQHYDLVILDLKLPGMRGSEVLRVIKRKGPEQKVIILSARILGRDAVYPLNSAIDEDEMILHMADAVLRKPVKVEYLLMMAKALITVGEEDNDRAVV
jgi:DNA-binding response OmpR family regulator